MITGVIAAILATAFARPLERVASMDPAFAESVYAAHAVQLVYETPLAIDYEARPYRLIPGACELPEISEDGRCYLFRMRGSLTAADMVRSLERLRDKSLVSPNAWYLKDVDTIVAIDEWTVEIKLKRPQHVFPWIMTMSGAAISKADGSGTGPFRLARWRRNHEMVFERQPRAAAADGFDTVRYLVVDDASTRWLMFLRGELDLLSSISRDNWDAVVDENGRLRPELARQGVTLHSMPTLESLYIGFNMRDKVVGQNKALRQALSCAFDFPTWEKFYSGRIVEAGGPVPPTVDGALPAAEAPYRFNLEKARRLMREAGYPDGIDPKTGRRLVLEMAIGRPDQESRESAELVAAFFERIGVKLEMRCFTWEAFLKAVNEGRVQMFRMGWVGDYPDAQNFLQLFYSHNIAPGPNRACYRSEEFDRAYEAMDWRRCQEIVREDCPWIFTHINKANTLVRSHVGNFIPSDFPYGSEVFFKYNRSNRSKE